MSGPSVVLVRHGETAWTISGRHTSRTDVDLTDGGREAASALRPRLDALGVTVAWSSPRRRARLTAELAGYAEPLVLDDLTEWDYGDDEGRTTAEIRVERPGWSLWRDGVPGGETGDEVAARADRVLARVREQQGATVALFSHGHFLRVLAARWLDLGPEAGRFFGLAPASISVLGWEREQPVLASWNVTAVS
jgi:probable phosphoglycerate mutase